MSPPKHVRRVSSNPVVVSGYAAGDYRQHRLAPPPNSLYARQFEQMAERIARLENDISEMRAFNFAEVGRRLEAQEQLIEKECKKIYLSVGELRSWMDQFVNVIEVDIKNVIRVAGSSS